MRVGELYSVGHSTAEKLKKAKIKTISNITREETVQMSLFPDEDRDKARKFDKAYDAINSKLGSATVACGTNMKSNLNVVRNTRHRWIIIGKGIDLFTLT